MVVDDDGVFWEIERIPEPSSRPLSGRKQQVLPCPEDIFFVLDANWGRSVLRRLEPLWALGLTVGVLQHDVIPWRFPETCSPEMPASFDRWMAECATYADFFACVSEATRVSLLEEFSHRHPWRRLERADTYVFRLGADFAEPSSDPSVSLKSVFYSGRPVYVVVGTLEPRKNHAVVLDAFEDLWVEGHDVGLCLIGARGWNVEDLISRIMHHRERGRRLWWFDKVPDGDLAYAYSHARAVILASLEEGFGLPLVEAQHFGAPVLASNISVFREIAGDRALFFEPRSKLQLMELIKRLKDAPEKSAFAEFQWPTWQESAIEFLNGLNKVASVKPVLRHRVRVTRRLLETGSRAADGEMSAPLGVSTRASAELRENLSLRMEGRRPSIATRVKAHPVVQKWLYQRRALWPLRWMWATLRQSNTRWRVLEAESRLAGLEARIHGLESHIPSSIELRQKSSLVQAEVEQVLERVRKVENKILGIDAAEIDIKQQNKIISNVQKDISDLKFQAKRIEDGLKEVRNIVIPAPQTPPFSVTLPVEDFLPRAERRIGVPAAELEPSARQQWTYAYFSEMWGPDYEKIRLAQYQAYLPFIPREMDSSCVALDLGCGAGEFVEFLTANGIPACGVDVNASEVQRARRRGRNVLQADILSFLENSNDCYRAISLIEVIEHLDVHVVSRLVQKAVERLAVGGVLLIETINLRHPMAFHGFFTDPTHVRPVPDDYLAFLFQWEGLGDIQRVFTNPAPLEAGTGRDITRLYYNYALVGKKI
ncbi:MAG: glycosyltransferase [Firmicutes bacterium]|nr:glycosyltransferase [Alicyclobacillaceae bacterium]MCL6497436.1 glycosyltransferase [Bacillota bacterium]